MHFWYDVKITSWVFQFRPHEYVFRIPYIIFFSKIKKKKVEKVVVATQL